MDDFRIAILHPASVKGFYYLAKGRGKIVVIQTKYIWMEVQAGKSRNKIVEYFPSSISDILPQMSCWSSLVPFYFSPSPSASSSVTQFIANTAHQDVPEEPGSRAVWRRLSVCGAGVWWVDGLDGWMLVRLKKVSITAWGG